MYQWVTARGHSSATILQTTARKPPKIRPPQIQTHREPPHGTPLTPAAPIFSRRSFSLRTPTFPIRHFQWFRNSKITTIVPKVQLPEFRVVSRKRHSQFNILTAGVCNPATHSPSPTTISPLTTSYHPSTATASLRILPISIEWGKVGRPPNKSAQR